MLRRLALLLCTGALTSVLVTGCDDEFTWGAPRPNGAGELPGEDPVEGPSEVAGSGEAPGPVERPTPAPRCGDGKVDPGELCDDGNRAGGDGCSAGCQTEAPPSLCELPPVDACEACGCSDCLSEMEACNNLEGVAAAGPAAGTAKSLLCQRVVACGQQTGCRGTACFCGELDLITCLTFGPQGPCKNEISAAAETTDPIDVSARQSTPEFAIAAANAVSICSVNSCTAACE